MGMHIYLTMYNIIGSILHISIGGDACAIAYDHLMYYPLIVSTLMCFRLYSDNLYTFGYMKRKKIEYIDMMVIETILPVTFSVDCTLLNKHIQTYIYLYLE
jgi:hypothetical protein